MDIQRIESGLGLKRQMEGNVMRSRAVSVISYCSRSDQSRESSGEGELPAPTG